MSKMKKKKRVVVFGIFDGIHEGHRSVFKQALLHGDELIAVVGRDSVALSLKGKKPKYLETERVVLLQKEPRVSQAVLGDKELSTYEILKQMKPDIVCLGYDQQELGNDLAQWLTKKNLRIEIFFLKSHKPHIFHNSKTNLST